MRRDAPNAWAPHQYIILQALRALPSNVSQGTLPVPNNGKSTFDLIPSGQLGIAENQLPQQPRINNVNGTFNATGPGADINSLNTTVFNGGNATNGEGWSHRLQRELANRYITSAFCSWWVHSFRSCSSFVSNIRTGEQQEDLLKEFCQSFRMLS